MSIRYANRSELPKIIGIDAKDVDGLLASGFLVGECYIRKLDAYEVPAITNAISSLTDEQLAEEVKKGRAAYLRKTNYWAQCQYQERHKSVWVYFIKGGQSVKIGFSTGVQTRLYALQSGSPVKLELIGEMLGGALTEAALHEKFKPYRTHGEWFTLSKPIRRFIAEHAQDGW